MSQTLQEKYPDVKICTAKDCKLDQRQHEVFYKYEQEKETAKKTGKILVYYTFKNLENIKDQSMIKFFSWWNGKKWVTL